MALALTVTDHWTDGKRIHVVGTIVASGNYSTGGDTISFVNNDIRSTLPPVWFEVLGQGLFTYLPIKGTTIANGKIKAITAGAEVAAGAYPGGVTGDTIAVYAIFHKFI